MQTFKLSIVTIHLNDFEGLRRTHDSLRKTLPSGTVEWLVIDGASEPDTGAQQAILDRVRDEAHQYLSGPDRGIYDAMNKGAAAASGEYLLFLNAGDRLHDQLVLADLYEDLQQKPDMLWGCYDEAGRAAPVQNIKPRSTRFLWWNMPSSHQAMLFRRSCLGAQPYNPDFRIAGDLDLVIRLIRDGATVHRSEQRICVADYSGASNTRTREANRELGIIRKRYFHIPLWASKLIAASRRLIGRIGAWGALRRAWKT